ncbi:MAG: head GIN domain-containing protein [Bacteroidota bacterium]
MSTLAKIIVTSLVSLLFMSCIDINYGPGVDGNGNVVSTERDIPTNFNAIEVSRGLDLYLTQSNDVSLTVEADENLHDIIMTEVENNVLKVYTDGNIRRSSKQAVYLNFDNVTSIRATSGSDVYGQSTISASELNLRTTSGADMDLDVNTSKLYCEATSGSDVQLSGTTDYLSAEATSGSDIKAQKLKAQKCDARATSGADVAVNTSNELVANASSGGDIRYYGNPKKVDKSDSVSGSVSKQ